MTDQTRPGGIDIQKVKTRLDILSDTMNKSVQEINQTGRLRVNVERAFSKPDELVKLIGAVCLLKAYAASASQQFGEPMTLEKWMDVERMFSEAIHIMPGGKLS